MHIQCSLAVHQIAHENEAFVNHGDEGIRAAPPSVAIGDFFEEVRFFVEGLVANLDVHAEVRAHVEGRVNVDELEAAGVLDLAAERAAFEGGEDELVVAPDEFVGPALTCRPPESSPSSSSSWFSFRGSSMCSRVWKGRIAVQTSRVLPFQTSSTSRLSSNRTKRYFSGSAFPSFMSLMRSRFSASVNS